MSPPTTPTSLPTLPPIRHLLAELRINETEKASKGNYHPTSPPPPFVVPLHSTSGHRRTRNEYPSRAQPLSLPSPSLRSTAIDRTQHSYNPEPEHRRVERPLLAGHVFGHQILQQGGGPPPPVGFTYTAPPMNRGTPSSQALQNYPTYILSADECPPDDDRRHGCGICHRRFNRPSSLLIHMNSHTGAQPFECPFPGCTRRFSVNSNMRRHYRNHRESGAPPLAPTLMQSPYAVSYRAPEAPRTSYYTLSASPSASSTYSSFTDGSDDRSDDVSTLLDMGSSPHRAPVALGRSRSHSDAYPPRARDAAARRPRSCTVPGCDCHEAPATLRPAAFHDGPSPAPAPPSAASSPSPSTPGSAPPFGGAARDRSARR